MNNIDLKSIKELLGMNFFIPNYQRGYRWTHQQVRDLLEDIKEFINNNKSNIYCIQPLVVKHSPINDESLISDIKQAESIDEIFKLIQSKDIWEVIDGQQRLTTIYIILKYLQLNKIYTIDYKTRSYSWNFLSNDIMKYEHGQNVDNIDFFHMGEAYCVIKDWFKKNEDIKAIFLDILLERVKFIWYEVGEGQNSKEIFQRLNLGKISLTNSELIKAILLKRTNNEYIVDSSVLKISSEWDMIENELQNDELWAFINSLEYESSIRIDYIFEILCSKNIFNLSSEYLKEVGDDEYATFRYFYVLLKNTDIIAQNIWEEVYRIYEIFNEWYNSSIFYHYIGYIIVTKGGKSSEVISNLIDKWLSVKDKREFESFLISEICKIIKNKKLNDLSIEYDTGGKAKSECRPLLLLHNIETIVLQNKQQESTRKFGTVFYRFPYNLYNSYKGNVGWDVEHIDSNTENELKHQKDRKEYLEYAYLGTTDEKIKSEISKLLVKSDNIEDAEFQKLRNSLCSTDNTLASDEKNKIWNFALLDSKTNRGYGNSPFPAKRRVIIGKEQGLKYEIIKGDNGLVVKSNREIATFIPPCTRNVFLKYYSTFQATNLTSWLKDDAKNYKLNILEILGDKFKITDENEKDDIILGDVKIM